MILKMREIAPTVIIVALVAFVATIFFSWGMDVTGIGSRPKAGVVEGKQIPLQTFDRMVNEERQRLQQSYKGEVPPQQYSMVPEQVWERVVSQHLMRKAFKEMALGASADEVFENMRRNPPPGIDTVADFQTDGVFDTSKYVELLNNPAIYDTRGWRQMELHTQQYIVPNSKLEALLAAAAVPSRLEIEQEYRRRNERGVFEYAYLNAASQEVDSAAVTDEMVFEYYETHKDSFESPQQVELYYVSVPKKATPQDEKVYLDELRQIRDRILAGESSFAEEAAMESDDEGSAENGGDLGWFGTGMMVPAFEQAAFAAEIGQVTEPVKSAFGYHIILVEDKRVQDGKEQVKARHILRKVTPSLETLDSLKETMDSVATAAEEVGLLKAAAEVGGVKVDSTGLFARGEQIPGIGFIPGVTSFAYTNEPGAVSEGAFENRDAFYVFEIRRRVPEGILPLADVRDRINRTLRDSLRYEKARERLAQALASHEGALAEVSSVDSTIASGVSDTVTRASYVAPLGYANEAIAVAFALEAGTVSTPIEVGGGVCVVKPVWHERLESVPLEGPEIDEIRRTLKRSKGERAYMAWYMGYKDDADVKSNLDKYYLD